MSDMYVPYVAMVAVLFLGWVAHWTKTRSKVGSLPLPSLARLKTPEGLDALVLAVRQELVARMGGRIEWSRPIEELRQELRPIVEHILALSNPLLSLMEHHFIVQTVVEGIGRRDEHSEATV